MFVKSASPECGPVSAGRVLAVDGRIGPDEFGDAKPWLQPPFGGCGSSRDRVSANQWSDDPSAANVSWERGVDERLSPHSEFCQKTVTMSHLTCHRANCHNLTCPHSKISAKATRVAWDP